KIFDPKNGTYPLEAPESEVPPLPSPHRPRRPHLSACKGREMARLLAFPGAQLATPFLPQGRSGPSQLLVRQKTLLPWGRSPPLPKPPDRDGPSSPHPYLRIRPPH